MIKNVTIRRDARNRQTVWVGGDNLQVKMMGITKIEQLAERGSTGHAIIHVAGQCLSWEDAADDRSAEYRAFIG